MTGERFCELAGRLMRCPAVAYHEQAVRAEAELVCAEHGLLWDRDRFGNLIVRLLTAPKTRTLVLAAHMDHPAFEIIRALSPERWLGRFLGGVPQNYFRAGIPLRLLPDGRAATLGPAAAKPKQFEIYAVKRRAPRKRRQTERSRNSAPAQFAVWELEDFAVRDGRLHGRSCDDLIGVAAVLASLIELKERRARVNVIGVISRAEEIGFLGALTIATQKILPADSLIISLETSREIPPIQIGQGVIIRVGDRSSIFDSRATRFLSEVAQGLKRKEASFQFQRALMSGGTCEATAYQEFGFQTGAACIALGNYHNCGAREKIQAEFVSISDAGGMVSLMVEVARQMPAYTKLVSKLPRHLHNLLQTARKTLPR